MVVVAVSIRLKAPSRRLGGGLSLCLVSAEDECLDEGEDGRYGGGQEQRGGGVLHGFHSSR